VRRPAVSFDDDVVGFFFELTVEVEEDEVRICRKEGWALVIQVQMRLNS
jgi:hypothetical protein